MTLGPIRRMANDPQREWPSSYADPIAERRECGQIIDAEFTDVTDQLALPAPEEKA